MKKIALVVEDMPHYQQEANKAFRKHKYLHQYWELIIADTIEAAEKVLEEHREHIGLIFMDYFVPGEVTNQTDALTQNTRYTHPDLPIIAISSCCNTKLRECGASESIVKDDLAEKLPYYLEKYS